MVENKENHALFWYIKQIYKPIRNDDKGNMSMCTVSKIVIYFVT